LLSDQRCLRLADLWGMSKRHPKIPADIDAELSPRARKFFGDMIDDYERRIAELMKRIEELEAKLQEMEAKLQKLTPKNSSIPPSSQHPHAKPAKPNKPKATTKKQGGQPGHAQATRPLIPTEECDDVKILFPKQCRRCKRPLKGKDPKPIRHQVTELPPIKPHVTEYQLHRLLCEHCGTQTCAQLPEAVPTGQCGPRLAAFTGLLMGHFRQSKRRAASFLSDLLNVPCSPSWTVKIQSRVSDALAAPHEELRSELQNQKQLFIDESPTKQNKSKAWLWVAVAPMFAVFGIFLSRKREALQQLVGKYKGIIINCDRAKMYFDGKRLQWCWSHLKRDIQKLIDSPNGQVKRLGYDLMRQQRLLFEQWRLYKAEKITWTSFRKSIAPIRTEFDSLLLRGQFSGNDQLYGMCAELYTRREWLWTFTKVKGIEPTNNTAERALRPAVIYRKLSFGTQSASGSRFIERILTVSETCKMQKRSPYEYLVETMEAHFANKPAPSLLPKKELAANRKAA
jgi:transposase